MQNTLLRSQAQAFSQTAGNDGLSAGWGPQTGSSSGQQQQEQPGHTLRQFGQAGG